MSGEDLQDFYENIDFEIVESFEAPSPSGTIKLKHVFPMTAEARKDYDKDDEVDLIELAGRGGQKVVFKACLHSDGRNLALAFMGDSCDLDEVENFFREARIATSLKHPSIVNTHNFGIDEQFGPYSVMDWVEGETLNHILRKMRQGVDVYEQVFTLKKLTEYFLDICKAVSFAHSKDIIHLDIKPENILIDYDQDKSFLFDWGLAKAFAPLENFNIDPLLLNFDTKEGYFRGTPGYMPPEQITERTKNEKTDIYQLGALLYNMLFKHCPVEGDNVEEILQKTLDGEIFVDALRPEMLPLVAVCKKAMSPDPEDRYSNVRTIIDEVKKVKFPETKKFSKFWLAAAVAVVPLIMVLCGFMFIDDKQYEMKIIETAELRSANVFSSEGLVSNTLLSTEDIALLEEFSHFNAEEYDTPLYMSSAPVPNWYRELDSLMKKEMGSLLEEEMALLLKIENWITFYKMEEGL